MLADVPRNSLNDGIPWKSKNGIRGKVPGVHGSEVPRKKASKQSCFLGVETSPELVWEGWQLGAEYSKLLTLKNIHGKLQKLSFRPPVSKFFTTLFPQTIVLSTGTSFSLPVTFRPLQKCEYVDSIEFQCKEGTFQVLLRAVLPHHALELPDAVQLPPCAVRHSSGTGFLLRNVSKLRTGFQWAVEPPFELSPVRGILEPGGECKVTATFKPDQALVYQAEASCTFGEDGESRCTMYLRGLSKYPHLQIISPDQEDGCGLLEFGSVAIGSSSEKQFEICNPSSVSACFSLALMRRAALVESVFQCDVWEGQVAAHSALRVPVCFTPLAVDSASADYLSLTCLGAVSRCLLKVTGSCIGPDVSLSSSLVDFGCVEEGGEAVSIIHIINSSTVLAYYQFDMDPGSHSVFSVDQLSGNLPANSSLTLRLTFRPRYPIAYHKRSACLILHRDPLFLDLIGTCHSEELKPTILHSRHLRVYRQNLLRGLTCYPPDILSAMLAEDKLQLDESGSLLLNEETSRAAVSLRSPMEEYFHPGWVDEAETGPDEGGEPRRFPTPHVTVHPSELHFDPGLASQSVSITNRTKGKLSLLWTPSADSPFSVTPLNCDLSPLKSTAFRVTYAPKQHNTFHAAQLECFALYKVLCDHRQTDEQTLCPPWCLTVRVSAHSFQPGNEHFIPHFSLLRPHVTFPALSQVSYRSVLLQNTGDLPLIFRLDSEECPAVRVQPSSGLVSPGSHQILTLRSTPSEDHPPSFPLTLHFNANPRHTQTLRVASVAEKPRVVLDGGGRLFFTSTAVGSLSTRTLRVRNLSRVPVQFHWKVCGSDRKVLSVQPDASLLQPNESRVQTWSFTPLEEMMYIMKATLTFWPAQTPDCKRSRLSLEVMGAAAKASIEASPSVLDLGEVLVGDCKLFEVRLLNSSSCAISFSLSVLQTVSVRGSREDTHKDPVVLELESMQGTIPSRCRLPISSTVRPTRRARYCWTISYRTLSASGWVVGEPRSLCQVQAEAVYPTLEVTDARSSGGVEGLSKLQLWGLFSLDLLNAYLCSDPSPAELTYRVPTRHSFRRCPPVFTSVVLDFNFSAAPLGADPSSFLLMFENTGNIPVEWSFLFPEDQQIELEYWAESGEFTSTELHQMKVQDNRLFSITPCSGRLNPGQQRAVRFTYRHYFTGTYRLPVLLKLSHGREILLNFVGVTVERDRHYLHFASARHMFAPVAVGGFHPPTQVYELYNGGALPVRYHVDTSPLEQLQEENFSHPVLHCLNPDGEVQPGRSATLEWLFSPLEAKTYSVDVPVYVLQGDCTLLTFEGSGFDQRDTVPFQLHGGHLGVACTQKVPAPGQVKEKHKKSQCNVHLNLQVVFLSEEAVSFGDIPVCSRSTRILFLTNISHTDSIQYLWNLKEQEKKQAVQIQPVSGSLAAGESVLCILTILTSGSPAFYQQDLICEVTPEEAVVKYHMDLQQWELEREREKHEFTITEKDVTQANPQKRRTQACMASKRKTFTATRKYKMPPPIRSRSSSIVASGANGTARRVDRRSQPRPPRPALLHLGVTARSHSLLEYQAHFPSHFHKYHISRSIQPQLSQCATGENRLSFTHMPPLSPGPERDILTYILTSLLRTLLDDREFHQALRSAGSERVPYFTQLRPPALPPSRTLSASATLGPWMAEGACSSEPTPAPRHTESASTAVELESGTQNHRELQRELRTMVQESIHRSPEFGDLLEEILLNTLQNLMMEAFLGELVLTARPRIIALPPRRNSLAPRAQSRGLVAPEEGRDGWRPLETSQGPYMPISALLSNLESHQH
ncbi:cilia- and flagella-associated protein 65 isoform X1 [Electrophorus electricus]|uniref:cilia- and flagella-associated protein 65 isoform X1 n=1 Tax=Electrophorus electricus TaxID=8005 RepID=UPI0015CFECED|nr:cilia- and flagella-associated protein 65 isoform X1 [Electrophorus electricus]XP_035391664.1 cilia- and flagella-associated protein 65 isoform X1 [Electrophorus electricus]